MPLKSIREMTWVERRCHSLEARTFWAFVVGSVLVGLVALLIGLSLFSYALIGQYTTEAYTLCRSVVMAMDNVVGLDPAVLSGDVMDIYSGLSQEELDESGTETYQANFDAIEQRPDYQMARLVLHNFLGSSDVDDLYLGMYDRATGSLVIIADGDYDTETTWLPGTRASVTAEEEDTFLNWDGEGQLYHIVKGTKGGRVCTAGCPVRGESGEPVAFVLADITLKNVASGMRTFALLYIFALSVVLFLYSYLATQHTKKTVVEPINRIAEACADYRTARKEDMEQTDRFSMLNIRTGDEIENLALTLADMEKDMAEYVENLTQVTAEKQRVTTELDMAGKIQAAMLPHIFPPYPDRKEFDLYASMDPAKETGGDFYDFFLIDDDHLCVVMADVSGKGVPAALFMMVSKVIIQSYCIAGKGPAEILSKTNDALCTNNTMQMFVTTWLGILEISTGKFTAANAGHEFPVLKSPEGPYEFLKDPHGFVLGGFEDEFYEEYHFELQPGSRLFLYTDGVPEAMNVDREAFGLDRMLDALNADLSAAPMQTLKNVRKAVDDFAGEAEQFDDVTMLCLEYKGAAQQDLD